MQWYERFAQSLNEVENFSINGMEKSTIGWDSRVGNPYICTSCKYTTYRIL